MFNFGKCYKYLAMCNNGFYDVTKILSYGRPCMVVTGSRSVGKSTQLALLCLICYAVTGRTFAYTRRYRDDVVLTYDSYFDNAIEIYNSTLPLKKILAWKAERKRYWAAYSLDENEEPVWEPVGYYADIASQNKRKSVAMSDCVLVIYDEFIADDENSYLGSKDNPDKEWEMLYSYVKTINRGIGKSYRNEVALFCLGNKTNVYNPIAESLCLCDYLPNNGTIPKFTAPKGLNWVWENIDKVDATANAEEEDEWASLATDRIRQRDYNNEDNESYDYIKKLPDKVRYLQTLRLHGIEYGVYADENSCYYIDKPISNHRVISLDIGSHNKSDVRLIRKWREEPLLMRMSKLYCYGDLFFGSGKIQSVFLKYFEFTK